jgi:hypothetical protein
VKALVEPNGHVAQVCEEAFPVHPLLRWVDVPPDVPVTAGWTCDGKSFRPPCLRPGAGGRGGSGYGGNINIGGDGGGGVCGGDGGDAYGPGLSIGGPAGTGREEGGRGGYAAGGLHATGGSGGAGGKIGGRGGDAYAGVRFSGEPKPRWYLWLTAAAAMATIGVTLLAIMR